MSRPLGSGRLIPLIPHGTLRWRSLWGGSAPPAALFKFSRDRQMIHPNKHLAGWQGVLQGEEGHKTVRGTVLPTNACSGYNDLYLADRSRVSYEQYLFSM